MVNLFAWASIGEHGRVFGGTKGDQTGKEVRVAPYYYFGQNKCIRLRNPTRQKKVAEIAKFLALSNVIGYDQCTRTTLHEVCESYNWNWNLIKKAIINGTFQLCNTDCSGFYAVCVNIAYGKEKLLRDSTTRNLVRRCTVSNKVNFKLTKQFPPKKWKKGDAPIKEGKHIIINV